MPDEVKKTETTETTETNPPPKETEVKKTETTETTERTDSRPPAPGTGAHDTKTY
jgi:hypothetical protein